MSDAEPDRLDGAPHPRETAVLFGQDLAEAAFLASRLGGQTHHAWAITGPRGIGKATLAWRIARYMLAGGTGASLAMDPEHPVFRQTRALGAARIFLARRPWDEKAKRLRTAITIDEIRALKAFFQLSAPDGGWRVALVDAADDLTPQAANALLKTLEEPPPRSLILLVCHQPARLLPTLRSRCRGLRCAPLAAPDLAAALAAAGVAPPEDPRLIATLAAGSVGEAIRLISAEAPALYGDITALLAACPGLDRRRLIALAESCAGRGAEARYDAVLRLALTAVARLAQHATGRPLPPLTDAEAQAQGRLASAPHQARLWADLASTLAARSDHARAVHLDPAQVILDTFLRIDAAATEARASAA